MEFYVSLRRITYRRFNTSWERAVFLPSLLPTDLSPLNKSGGIKDKNYISFPKTADLWTSSACCIFVSYIFCLQQLYLTSEYIEQGNRKHLLDSLFLSLAYLLKSLFHFIIFKNTFNCCSVDNEIMTLHKTDSLNVGAVYEFSNFLLWE